MKNCPRCGRQVNDDAMFCQNCGYTFATQSVVNPQKSCSNCGAILPMEYNICPYCGCPVNGSHMFNASGYSMLKNQEKSNTHKAIWALVIVVILAVVSFAGWLVYKKIKDEKDNKEIARANKEYYYSIGDFYNEIADYYEKVDEAARLVGAVWHNTIFEKEDSKTDKYTRKSGGKGAFYDDINDSLMLLYKDAEFNKTIIELKLHQERIDELYKKLKNPPDKYKEAYSTVKKLYSSYSDLCQCAINPSGNYNSYSDKYRTSYDDTIKWMKELWIFSEGD